MAQFVTETTAKFAFRANQESSIITTLAGINATLPSADSICAGVTKLMAIGGNTPDYFEGDSKRTVIQIVDYDD